MSGLYHDKETRVGISPEVADDEEKAIREAAIILRSTRSALLDCQARMTTRTNKDDMQDILDWLPADATMWAEKSLKALADEKSEL